MWRVVAPVDDELLMVNEFCRIVIVERDHSGRNSEYFRPEAAHSRAYVRVFTSGEDVVRCVSRAAHLVDWRSCFRVDRPVIRRNLAEISGSTSSHIFPSLRARIHLHFFIRNLSVGEERNRREKLNLRQSVAIRLNPRAPIENRIRLRALRVCCRKTPAKHEDRRPLVCPLLRLFRPTQSRYRKTCDAAIFVIAL